MAFVEKMSPVEVRKQPSPLLVCAYEDESKCATIAIDGATSLSQFRARLGDISKDELIVFY